MKRSRTLVGIITAGALLFPAVAPAATTTDSNTQLISALQQLIQVLETELQQLLTLQHHTPPSTPTPTTTLTATPTSGSAPLAVTFHANAGSGVDLTGYYINFSDGSSAFLQLSPRGSASHTYTSAGTYTATLFSASGSTLGNVTITVTGSATSLGFTATPTSGTAPLVVTFAASNLPGAHAVDDGEGFSIDFDDGNKTALDDLFKNNAQATHTYTTSGTYVAKLIRTVNPCVKLTNCYALTSTETLATVTITVGASNIQKITTPASVTLSQNEIAEVRDRSFYFTLTSLGAKSATIQVTPVGCWNWFPSDPVPAMRCMIASVATPPVTLTVGQSTQGNATTAITLTGVTNASATFSVAPR